MKRTSIHLCLLSVVFTLMMTSGFAQNQQPNLLVIHTDEQSFRSLSCYENCWPEADTPNLDRLAKEGVRFENFFVNHPVCTPSRSALLTGRYAHEVRSYLNDISMADEAVTFAHVLRENGYETGYIGKLHLDGDAKPGFKPQRDFGFTDNRFMFNRGHWKEITEREGLPQVKGYGVIGDEDSYTTDYLSDKARTFIKQHQGDKWCCMLSIPDPHGPDVDRLPYNEMYKPKDVSMPESFRWKESEKPNWAARNDFGNAAETRFRRTKGRYLGMVKHIDDCVGEILSTLDKIGQLENTVIVFTSDHGDMMGEFGRYNKGIPLDASAKVSHIIRYPKKIKRGQVVNKVVSNVDFMPTIFDLLDVKYQDKQLRGESAVSLIEKKNADDWKDLAFISVGKNVAVVSSEYKLVFSGKDKPWLYDRLADEKEQHNCFNDPKYQAVVKDLTRKLKSYLQETNDPNWTGKLVEFQQMRKKESADNSEFVALKDYVMEYSK